MNWPALLDRRPWTAAFGLGLGLSLVSAPASLGVGMLADALLPDGWFGESAAGDLSDMSALGFLLMGVLSMPALETLLGQCLPIEPLRRLSAPPLACVLASALLFSSYHLMGGGLGHALTTLVSGSLFALAYWLCRPAGFRFATAAAYATHASHNFLVWFVLGPLLGQ